MFIDIPTKQICYFDSGGDEVPKEIKVLADRITQQGKQLGIDFKFEQNYPFEHQMEDTECGVYSLYFISTMIETPDFKVFKTKRIPDKDMEKYRHVYFRI